MNKDWHTYWDSLIAGRVGIFWENTEVQKDVKDLFQSDL